MRTLFDYYKPRDIADALTLLGPKSKPYQGGTDLLVQLRAQKLPPRLLVDVKGLAELEGIKLCGDRISIGAATTAAELAQSAAVLQWAPGLAAGAHMLGSPSIRNKATVAGNIATASPAGDMLNACWGLDAKLLILSARGEREQPLSTFVSGPGKTELAADELIARVELPMRQWSFERFFKTGRRNAMAISVVNGICALELDRAGIITDARISLGAVSATPLRIAEAEALLLGRALDAELAERAADAVRRTVAPISDVRAGADYRRYMAALNVYRALCACLEECYGN